MKEMDNEKLNLNELEQANGGFVLAAFITAAIGGAIAGAITYYELKRWQTAERAEIKRKWKGEKNMNTDKMNLNELEQASGGNFLDDIKEALKRLIPNPFAPEKPIIPDYPKPIIANDQ